MRASDADWAGFDPSLLPLFQAQDDRAIVEAATMNVLRGLKAVIRDAGLGVGMAPEKEIAFAAAVSEVFANDVTIPRGLKALKPVVTTIASIHETFERDRSASLDQGSASLKLMLLKSAVTDMTRAGGHEQQIEDTDPRKVFATSCMLVSLMMATALKLYRGVM